ncbi:hypothetical protein K402DRAFT_352897 [Aulographum hederae CBS 113979]|uniref:ethanolamine-phosphate cytidylyltransferase n=1 Tax=Aulographum hederae CBS 113979 TaxID=1176131 RepID=A0A6G1H4Y2_9PEZI|nr:hypothetical protein K402DRAFT_352897 [Aulographum hederae CBS 113979]
MASTIFEEIPKPGSWPIDPQEDIAIKDERIWVDGCFDFFHHGHAGAMLQARQLGNELWVGLHSDEEIMDNKGPTVMNLQERIAAVEACRWVTKCVPYAPYVTSLPWISHYGCRYVVHGDDITSDAGGGDCYRFVKSAGRFKIVKRTPGISTTDLVGRMLLCTRGHFIKSLQDVLSGTEGAGSDDERKATAAAMIQRFKDYATDESGLNPGSELWTWTCEVPELSRRKSSTSSQVLTRVSSRKSDNAGSVRKMVGGKAPRKGQRVVYVDGGFDLFCSGHIEFLRSVVEIENKSGAARGWFTEQAKQQRIKECGEDYGPAYVLAGVHDDEVINFWKGVNYPIMNIFERGLCVLQCKYVHAVIFGAPFIPTKTFLRSLPYGAPLVVYHGPTSFMPLTHDPYKAAKELGIFQEVPAHAFQHVNAGEIVERILKSRAMYEERQRVKGVKNVGEEAVRKREDMEREAERMKRIREVERSQSWSI